MLFRSGGKTWEAVEVRFACGPDLPAVPADPNQMRQVLWNLLVNAVEATPGPRLVDVEARTSGDGAHITISVTDDGPGVPDPDVVFDPFYTTKPHGTGLGLAVVARIVRDHGGYVKVENIAGRGARFTVALPAAADFAEAPHFLMDGPHEDSPRR